MSQVAADPPVSKRLIPANFLLFYILSFTLQDCQHNLIWCGNEGETMKNTSKIYNCKANSLKME